MAAKGKNTKKKYTFGKEPVLRVAESQFGWTIGKRQKQQPLKIELAYQGKILELELFNQIPDVLLVGEKTYGQMHLHHSPNALIWGDNILALKCLLKNPNIAGKVNLVYIDPPFATKQVFKSGDSRTSTISASDVDAVAYEDNITGADFLEFLRHRLILLRDILSNEGSIYVHIDCKMGHYVKILMDEIFGQDHFINDITRIKCNPKNFYRRGYGNIKDMILFYSKTRHFIWNEPRTELSEEDIMRLFPKIDKDGRRYTTTPLHAPGETKNGATGKEWNGLLPPPGRHWRIPPKELNKIEEAGLVEWSSSGNPRKKIYADEVLAKGKKLQDVWELKDPPYPLYPTEKSLDLLKRIIAASSNPGDIVLDSFCGSGTTIGAAEHLGRRWIGIDNSKVAIERAVQRLKEIDNLSSFTLYRCSEMRRKANELVG